MYFAIIGDIISLKHARNKERYEIQTRLGDVLNDINEKYKSDIASDLTVTPGNECMGLLKNASPILEILDTIKYKSEPIEIRFGIGIGDVFTDLRRNADIQTDGPAFWHARYAVKKMQENKNYINPEIVFEAEDDMAAHINLINESLKLCDYTEKRWTDKQKSLIRESVLRFGHNTDIPQKDLAKMMGISVPAVNVHIKRSGYYPYLNLRKSIGEVLQTERAE